MSEYGGNKAVKVVWMEQNVGEQPTRFIRDAIEQGWLGMNGRRKADAGDESSIVWNDFTVTGLNEVHRILTEYVPQSPSYPFENEEREVPSFDLDGAAPMQPVMQQQQQQQQSGRSTEADEEGMKRGERRRRRGDTPPPSVGASKVETMAQENKSGEPMSTALVQGARLPTTALESINNAMLSSITSTQSAANTMRAQLLERVQQGAIGGDVLNASDAVFNSVQTELNTFLTRIFIGDAAAEATGQGNRPILRQQVQGEAGVDGTMITRPGMMVLFSPEVQDVVSPNGLDLGLRSNFPIQSGAQQLSSGNSSGQQRVLNVIPQEQWQQMRAEILQGQNAVANQERALGMYFRLGQGVNATGQPVTFYYIFVPRGNTLFNMSPEQYSEYADMVRSRGSWVGEQRDNRQTISANYRQLLDIEVMKIRQNAGQEVGLAEVRRMRRENPALLPPISLIRRTALYAQACVDVLINPTFLVQQQQQQMRMPLDVIALQEIRLTENIIRATTMFREIINLPPIAQPSNKRQAILHWMLGYFGQDPQQRRRHAREAARNYLWLQIELWYNWYINLTSRFRRDANGNMRRDAAREEGGAQYRSLATYNFTNGGVRIQEGDDGSRVNLLEYRLLEVPAYIRESLALIYLDESQERASEEIAASRRAMASVISAYEGLPAAMENVRHTTDLFRYVSDNQDTLRRNVDSGPEGALRVYDLMRNSVDLRSGITIEQLQQQVQQAQGVQANIAREIQEQQEVADGSAAASKQLESCRTGQSSGVECITDSMYARGMEIQLYLPRAQAQSNGLRPLQPAIIEIVGNGVDSPAQPGFDANGHPIPPMTESLPNTIDSHRPIAIGSYLINTGGSRLGGRDNRRIVTVIEINNILGEQGGQIIQVNYRAGIRHLMERTSTVGIDGQRLVREEEARRVVPGTDIITDRRNETAAARRRAYFAYTLAENNQQGALLAQVVQEMLRRQREQRDRIAQLQSQQQAQAVANQKQGEALMAQQGAQPANMALADDLFNSYFLYQRMHTQLNSLWYAGRQMDITGEYRNVGGVRQPPEEWFDRESYLNRGRTTLGGSELPEPRQTIVDVFVRGLRSLFRRDNATNLPTLGDLWNGGVPLSFVEFITRYQVGGGNPEQVMRTAFGPDILPTGEGLHDLAQAQRLDGEYRGWLRRRAQRVTPSQGASSSGIDNSNAGMKDKDDQAPFDDDVLGGGGRRKKKKTRSKKSKHSKMGARKKKTRRKKGGEDTSVPPNPNNSHNPILAKIDEKTKKDVEKLKNLPQDEQLKSLREIIKELESKPKQQTQDGGKKNRKTKRKKTRRKKKHRKSRKKRKKSKRKR